ncbi:MAG TPA: type II toxin-antitoxin system RelE/ParE family toxin [Acidobacteriaceae bacterium]|nr:type II toxin-antitoxin system RelE/ParE family toxin [Acidobacteriaceae bacterium]
MRLRLSPYVPRDLEEIAAYIALDSPRHALKTVRLLRAAFAEIAKQPKLYRLRPELAPDARIARVGRYLILFRIHKGTVRIERVVHGGRDLERILIEVEPQS